MNETAGTYEAGNGVATVLANPAPQSSVTLSQTAKGLTQVEIKCYAATVEEAARIAQEAYDTLCAKYARPEA